MATPNYITPAGLQRLRAEVDHLVKVERPRVVNEVADAAAMGDRSENAEYIYGKRKLREIDRRLRFLTQRVDAAVPVDPGSPQRRDRVYFGATVVLEDEAGATRTWTLVGEDEVDASAGLISHRSPVGAALLGKQVDDEVKVQTPAGPRLFTIAAIRYG
jgi:transcription elongation factor GreB